ncbi:hypothetical protein Goklo_020779 [Gossypium klotzschianum]|uniref:Uncharacterized protein n=1 Tax=Gossypium klotzschianum TaxID=34286 RepID=A0A7J8USZ2_9ROSI|nr:hypothetical protein [Gossypium klotzschianum]
MTKLEDQMSQLMSVMGDIKRQIGIGIPSNMEDNPWRKGKEHVKAISLQLGKILSSPETNTLETIVEYNDDPQEVSLEVKNEPESKEVITPVAEKENEVTKDSVVAKIPFPSRLEEKQRWDDDEFELVLEDMLVKVRSFITLADFVVLVFEDNREIPMLLRRPFLATSRSTIGLENNELNMKINGEIETFKCGHQSSDEDKRKESRHGREFPSYLKNAGCATTTNPGVTTKKKQVCIGKWIHENMKRCIGSQKVRVFFPYLVTALCSKAGVPMTSTEHYRPDMFGLMNAEQEEEMHESKEENKEEENDGSEEMDEEDN